MSNIGTASVYLPFFDRKFWDGKFRFTQIGLGSIGGKAGGLVEIKDLLSTRFADLYCGTDVDVCVPTLAVIGTRHFDEFINQNKLLELPLEEMSDQRIGMAFQKTDLPVSLLGDLRALAEQVKTPLAIRSSSLLEDKMGRPFAGVYSTKMIPNNQFDSDTRFRKLDEAIKCVYASTYFREAREYIRSIGLDPKQEKMAVILQEVVGRRHGDRFYPDISGVARSYNYYPSGPARPEEGMISLALGLGKTIVDGDRVWTYSPEYPRIGPPFGSVSELINGTQSQFWAVNMGAPPAYDPVSETEFMVRATLREAEADEVLRYLVSTYDPDGDRMVPGTTIRGPRVLDFSPILVFERVALNNIIKTMVRACENALDEKVEIEFALTIHERPGDTPRVRIGLLQVRPIVVSHTSVTVSEEDLFDPDVILASDHVLGNGTLKDVCDIVYVRPEKFAPERTPTIAKEIGKINSFLREQGRRYLLIGFGRWGSSHPSLGIPVDWSQISEARAIVETTISSMNVDPSQGSHFFHNLSSFKASYFMLHHEGRFKIDWDWLDHQQMVMETEHVRCVRAEQTLQIKVDGRTGRGCIRPEKSEKVIAE